MNLSLHEWKQMSAPIDRSTGWALSLWGTWLAAGVATLYLGLGCLRTLLPGKRFDLVRTTVILRPAPMLRALRHTVSAVVIFRVLLMLAGVCGARCAQIL